MTRAKASFELLDQYIFQRDYTHALEAISDEIRRRPDALNLLVRQAEIFGMAGENDKAIAVYRSVAEQYAQQGFYARAIAVANKVVRLDPKRQEVTRELAQLISARQAAEREAEAKLKFAEREGLDKRKHGEEPPPAAPAVAAVVPAAQPAAPPSDPAEQRMEREKAAAHFFGEFPPGALEQLLYSAAVHSFDPQEAIVEEGEPGTSFFLIEEGEVQVRTKDPSGKPMVLAELGAGEFFGEVAVLTGKPRTATIVATTPVTVIEISGAELDRIAGEFPDVRTVLHHFYERRAQATVEAMVARMRGKDV